MTTLSQWYCIQWNNHHSKLLSFFDELLYDKMLADVTLVLDNNVTVKCHKIVLAACSTYFRTLFLDLPCEHQTIVLKDIRYSEMKLILEYMYRGEMNVMEDQLYDLLKIAEALQVEGLVKKDSNRNTSDTIRDPRCADAMHTTTTSPLDIRTSINGGDDVSTCDHLLPLYSSMDHHSTVRNPYANVSFITEDEKPSSRSHAKYMKSSIPSKLKWKRYKSYTVHDMNLAINATKSDMSVAEAARKYGMPLRTLYDRLKKLKNSTSYKRSTTKKESSNVPVMVSSPTISIAIEDKAQEPGELESECYDRNN